jgi:hypothetical protein
MANDWESMSRVVLTLSCALCLVPALGALVWMAGLALWHRSVKEDIHPHEG